MHPLLTGADRVAGHEWGGARIIHADARPIAAAANIAPLDATLKRLARKRNNFGCAAAERAAEQIGFRAAKTSSSVDEAGAVLGTRRYVAALQPELAGGDVDSTGVSLGLLVDPNSVQSLTADLVPNEVLAIKKETPQLRLPLAEHLNFLFDAERPCHEIDALPHEDESPFLAVAEGAQDPLPPLLRPADDAEAAGKGLLPNSIRSDPGLVREPGH